LIAVRVRPGASFARAFLAARAQRGPGPAQGAERSVTVAPFEIDPGLSKLLDVFAAAGFFCPRCAGDADPESER